MQPLYHVASRLRSLEQIITLLHALKIRFQPFRDHIIQKHVTRIWQKTKMSRLLRVEKCTYEN
jgi:hypothetical protein